MASPLAPSHGRGRRAASPAPPRRAASGESRVELSPNPVPANIASSTGYRPTEDGMRRSRGTQEHAPAGHAPVVRGESQLTWTVPSIAGWMRQ